MRIALVRGPNLNPWELANYSAIDGLFAVGSQRGSYDTTRVTMPIKRLASPTDAVSRLPTLAGSAIARFGGNTELLLGFDEAVRDCDIVHTAELSTAYSGQAISAKESGSCKRVVATVWENIAAVKPPNRVIERRVRRVAAGLDHCIAISEAAKLHLLLAGVPDDRITVLPMGVDIDMFAPSAAPSSRQDGVLRILSVCRLVSEKGVEDILVAAHLLADRGITAEVTFAGSGPLRPWLEQLAKELQVDATFAGNIDYESLPELHRRHDVFVLASAPRATWREQFGFAVVEAMAGGLPVLAGDSGSLDEVVGDPEQLLRPHDPVALADRLAGLANDPELCTARGARNRTFATERYDRRRVRDAIVDIYDRVLTAPPRPT